MADSMIYMLLVVAAIVCAARAMAAERILSSAIFLAAVSALTAVLLYLQGAYQVAVIELSVGAGLVTVLLVYAISITGDEVQEAPPIVPRTLAGILAGVMVVALLGLSLPLMHKTGVTVSAPLSGALWGQRVLDVWIQMVLIFAGVLGILGLLTEGKPEMLQTKAQARIAGVAPRAKAGVVPGNGHGPSKVREEVHV
jgi:uncharacterized MnhB-related membrane protein